jgi:hypothetical protein
LILRPRIDANLFCLYCIEIKLFEQLPCEPICESRPPAESPATEAPVTEAPTSYIETQPPTDCYDLYGITDEDIIEQTGSDLPIPIDAIKIINGEYSNVTIGKHQINLLEYDM